VGNPSPSPASPEALCVWSDKLVLPEGKAMIIFVRNQADRDMTDGKLYYDPMQTEPPIELGTLPKYSITRVEFDPERVKQLRGLDIALHWKATAYDPVLAKTVASNMFIQTITSEEKAAYIKFVRKPGSEEEEPYPCWTCHVVNKKTGEHWEYEADREGVCKIPIRETGKEGWGDYCIVCHYQDPVKRTVAVGVIDPYDFKDYIVKAPEVDRAGLDLTGKVKDWEAFTREVAGRMPRVSAGNAVRFGGYYGWKSRETADHTVTFLRSYLVRVASAEVVQVGYDLDKDEIYVTVCSRQGSPIAWAPVLTLVTLIVLLIGFVAWTVKEWKHDEAEVVKWEKEEAEAIERTIKVLHDLYEAGAIDKETFEKAVENVTYWGTVSAAGTPPRTWYEKLAHVAPTILIGGLVWGGFYVFARYLLPRIVPPKR